MAPTPRVLVVDDDPDFLDLVVKRLSQDDFDITASESAHDALETLSERTIDCVVTDSLVLEDGKPLIRAVRDHDAEIPLIYYTGKDWSEVADDAVAASVSDYVQKGVGSFAEVSRRIDILVESDGSAAVRTAGGSERGETNGQQRRKYTIPELDEDDEEWEVIGEFDPESTTPLDVVLAETIAEHLDRDVDSFTLYDNVDAEALERLVLPRQDGTSRRSITVRFPLNDHLVAVTSAGEIAIRTQSPTA
jgi:DNA-binding response OmpR family regulator